MKSKKTYGKQDIIRMTKEHYDTLSYSGDKTLEDRLDKLIEFLNEERVQIVIEESAEGLHRFEMREIVKAEKKGQKKYRFTLVEVIFLSFLLTQYDRQSLKDVRLKSKPKDIESLEIELEFLSLALASYKVEWDEGVTGISWEHTWTYLGTILYKLLHLADHANENQREINKMTTLFEGLPDEHKIEVYEKFMKNRINYINKKLIEYIENLKEENPSEYSYYQSYKRLVEIDKEYDES